MTGQHRQTESGTPPALKNVDKTRSLLGNTSVLIFGQSGSIAVSLLLTPYIVSALGIERYGLWIFLGAIVSFASLFQLGLGRGSIRFIAFHSERGDLEAVRRIVTYGVFSHAAFGFVLAPLAWLLARALIPHLGIAADLVGTAETLFPLVVGLFFFSSATRPFAGLLVGLDRLWVTSLATLASQVVYAVAVVVLLSRGAGLYGLVAAAFIQVGFQGAACYAAAHRLIGRVFGNPFRLDRAIVKEMLKFGGWIQVVGLTTLVNRQTDAILIGSWVGLRSAGLYDLGNRIAQLTRTIPLALLGPLLPAAAGLHAQGDDKTLARTVLQTSRLLGLMTIGMAGLLISTAPLIMTVWLGRTYPDVAAITVIMVITYVVNNLTGVGTTIVSAIGQPRYEAEYAILGVILNLAATLALAPFYGLYGVLAGTLIGVGLCSVYFIVRFHRLMRYSLREYLTTWLWRVVAAAVTAGILVAGARAALPDGLAHDRGKGFVALVGLSVLYASALLVSLRLLRFFGAGDLAVLERILPRRLRPLTHLHAVESFFGVRT